MAHFLKTSIVWDEILKFIVCLKFQAYFVLFACGSASGRRTSRTSDLGDVTFELGDMMGNGIFFIDKKVGLVRDSPLEYE